MEPLIEAISFPAIRCRKGSAWHEWSREGAICAHKIGKEMALEHARIWAGQTDWSSCAVSARERAFKEGVNNVDKHKITFEQEK